MIEDTRVPPEVDVDPLSDLMLDFLIDHDNEEPFLDFKEILSVTKDDPFAKTAKDIFAFSNYGGGFILIGFKKSPKPKDSDEEKEEKEKRNYLIVGIPEDFAIDQAVLQEKFNARSNSPLQLQFREFYRAVDGLQKKLAAIYVPPSTCVLKPIDDGHFKDLRGKDHLGYRKGVVLFRRGTQSIPASREETAWIERRADRAGYRISVLSGQPDIVEETISTNLLPVVKLPELIWSAAPSLRKSPDSSFAPEPRPTAVYVMRNDRIISFEDLSDPNGPLWSLVRPETVGEEEVEAWLEDPDRRRIIVELLNKEIRFLAERIGLLHEPRKSKFYFSCDGDNRKETWIPRFREISTLTVAQRMWAQQLHHYIFWHTAVVARFTQLDDRLYLMLTPTLQLTEDGHHAIFGQREGTVITRLTYNRYNSSYLNSLLFWIFKLAKGLESIPLAGGKVLVSAEPAVSKLPVGILSDRPASEVMEETPEIEIEEETKDGV